jgi:hypothetical protein
MILSGQRLSSACAVSLAKAALEECGRFWFGNEKVESELYELDLLTEEQRYMAVDIVLQEIAPCWRLGPQPPNDISRSGHQLYAFYWDSPEFKKFMYFKFAILPDAKRNHLVLHSFHESTDKESNDLL